jgi:peroxiredoxin
MELKRRKQGIQALLYLIVFMRWGVGFLFIFSGSVKLLDVQAFAQALNSFAVVSPRFVPALTYAIPLAEICLGAAFILMIRVELTANILTGVLVLFTAVIFEKLIEGAKLSCGCFGDLSTSTIGCFGDLSTSTIDWWTFARNICLILSTSIIGIAYGGIKNFSKKQLPQSELLSGTPQYEIRKNFKGIAIYLLALLVFAQYVTMYLQNRTLKDRVEILTRDHYLKAGDIVTSVSGYTPDGDSTLVDVRKNGLLLVFIMKIGCSYCEESLPEWNTLAGELSTSKIPIVGIVLDSLNHVNAYLRKNQVKFPLVSTLDKKMYRIFKIQSIPMTILLKSDTVIFSSDGTFDFRSKPAILHYLKTLNST